MNQSMDTFYFSRIIQSNPEGNMNVCTKCTGNPSNS